MYENLIYNIVLWQRRLDLENQQPKTRPISPAIKSTLLSAPSRGECRTIFTWNYKFEKDFQPLFNGLSRDCVAVTQPC